MWVIKYTRLYVEIDLPYLEGLFSEAHSLCYITYVRDY